MKESEHRLLGHKLVQVAGGLVNTFATLVGTILSIVSSVQMSKGANLRPIGRLTLFIAVYLG